MPQLGYALSSEEHGPLELVRNAARAEQAGFEFALISDHFHPWTARQGESPFVWSVIGGIAQATERLRLGTGVTCPTIRTHPAIVAHASATAAVMMEGRFFLGVGSGENLNEHILADRWPTALEWFPNIALGGELTQELPQPAHFEQAAELLSEDDIAQIAACGPDPERHVEMIQRFVDAGCDHVYLHQIGPDQDGFFDFYEREVLPRFSSP